MLMTVFERLRKDRWFVLVVVSFALFTDTVVYATIVPLISDILEERNISAEKAGWLYAAYSIAYLIFPPVVGYISDHHNERKLPLILGQTCLVASTVLLSSCSSLPILLLTKFLQGILGFEWLFLIVL